MFNRSDILRKAWAAYRLARLAVFVPGDGNGKRVFRRSFFAKMLRRAWDEAKKAAAVLKQTATALLQAQRRVQVATAAAMAPQVRSARIVAILEELRVLDYAPWGVRTGQRRHALGAELSLLETSVI